MRNLKRVVLAVFVLLLVLATLAFVLENQQSVSLLFLGWSGPQLPVSLAMLFALLMGMLIGPLLGWFIKRKSLRSNYPG
ncbi:LapA family protein [Pseudomonas gregormendelii]|uniref:LapA family protein n=1 Tax=Pseudomonas gregormendelii TaxID=1628277 RepID=A0ABS3AFM3_9PSED|nr:LapA family protein [Pseudomonas gregormendelii]MBN3965673.1 LapA family protein [Pseudomonas gregormendelii]